MRFFIPTKNNNQDNNSNCYNNKNKNKNNNVDLLQSPPTAAARVPNMMRLPGRRRGAGSDVRFLLLFVVSTTSCLTSSAFVLHPHGGSFVALQRQWRMNESGDNDTNQVDPRDVDLGIFGPRSTATATAIPSGTVSSLSLRNNSPTKTTSLAATKRSTETTAASETASDDAENDSSASSSSSFLGIWKRLTGGTTSSNNNDDDDGINGTRPKKKKNKKRSSSSSSSSSDSAEVNGSSSSSSWSNRFAKLVQTAVFGDDEEWVTVFAKRRIDPGEIVPVTVAGIDLLVVASNDGKKRLFCIANSCPHLGTPLELGALVRLPKEDGNNNDSSSSIVKEDSSDTAGSWGELEVSSLLQQDGCEDCIVCPLHKTAFALESGQVRGEWCPYPPVVGKMVGAVKPPTGVATFDVRVKGKDVQVRMNTPIDLDLDDAVQVRRRTTSTTSDNDQEERSSKRRKTARNSR